ncbi:MAG: hypothetical protein WCQ77_08860, partial [Planctomycetota bacterium]
PLATAPRHGGRLADSFKEPCNFSHFNDRQRPGKDALQPLNAWSSDLQVCLGQVAVDKDSNEITAPKSLRATR